MRTKNLLWLALGLYAVALVTPALVFVYDPRWPEMNNVFGYSILMNGWLGPLDFVFGWYANIFILIALIFLRRDNYRKAFIFSIIALIVGASTFFIQKYMINEGGDYLTIKYLGVGFYLWMGSFVVVSWYAYLMQKINLKHTQK